jgi:Chaperone of endosialidase
MNLLLQLRRATPLFFVGLILSCFAVSPLAQAVTPAPDGSYPGFNTAEGFDALLSLTSGTFDTALGVNALKLDTTASFNTAVGAQALLHNNGSSNTAVGVNALLSNTVGSQNTAVGQAALISNTSGDASTAIGFRALYNNTAGVANTAIGSLALLANVSGELNTAIGFAALGFNTTGKQNTGTGVRALLDNRTGGFNTAVGYEALVSNTLGNRNTAIGEHALEFNTAGSGNVAVGVDAGQQIDMGSNNIDIGNFGSFGDANTIRIGSVQTRTFIAGIRGRTTGNANAMPVLIDSAGQLGTMSSSRRFKKEIEPMDQTSEAVLALKPVTFHYKSDSSNTPQFGLIAEEVAKVNPDLVVRDENGEVYTVRYDAVNAMLLNEFLKEHRTVQEQQKEIDALKAELKEQRALIQKVSAKLDANSPAPQVAVNGSR